MRTTDLKLKDFSELSQLLYYLDDYGLDRNVQYIYVEDKAEYTESTYTLYLMIGGNSDIVAIVENGHNPEPVSWDTFKNINQDKIEETHSYTLSSKALKIAQELLYLAQTKQL